MTLYNQPYFFTPHSSKPGYPIFVFLPGMDETGKELLEIQTAGLEANFDVRCFVIPADDLTSWDHLAERALALTQAEAEPKITPRPSIYLCGESFGGCIALKMLLKAPELFDRVVLINPASSFHRVPWLNLGSRLFPWLPEAFYQISSYTTLPFLAPLNRLSSKAAKALLGAVHAAPKSTAQQRLCLMREFEVNEQQLSRFTQPVLLIASQQDRLLPSVAEANHLARIFPRAQQVTLPDSGHACLVETDTDLLKIMASQNCVPSNPKTLKSAPNLYEIKRSKLKKLPRPS